MIDLAFLQARIDRLDVLIAGLTSEVHRMRSGDRRSTHRMVPIELLAYAEHLEHAARYLGHARCALARAHEALTGRAHDKAPGSAKPPGAKSIDG